MPGTKQTSLPIPSSDYDRDNEAITRRNLELIFDEVQNDLFLAKTQGDSQGSLAMRRFQFLLMGAS